MIRRTKRSGTINPASITDEKTLIDFLAKIGFKSRPISQETSAAKIRPRNSRADLPPQRLLFWQDNEGFENDAVVVSVEEGVLYIRYYQEENDLFDIWEKFSGKVEIESIKQAIRSAVTRKDIAIMFSSFWPERIQTGEDLDLILVTIGVKSRKTTWPLGLPGEGVSANAPHRLIVAQGHNLDTDALVAVEQLTVYVYYRDPASGAFREWARLLAEKDYSKMQWADSFSREDQDKIRASILPEVKYSVLYDAIISAMTGKKKKQFGG